MDRTELIDVFTRLGAKDPQSWAVSEIDEGIPQLARYLFLKGAWNAVVGDGDSSWIEQVIENTPAESSAPYSGTAHALRHLLAAGADPGASTSS